MGTIKVLSTVLVACGIMHFIGGVYLLHCPKYMKHEAIREGLLDKVALCRAMPLAFNEVICLDGFKTTGYYCATGSCNIFGYNCDGHCLSGEDNGEYEKHFELKCETTASIEREKLCGYYQNQFDDYKAISMIRETKSRVVDIHVVPPEITGITIGTGPWPSAKILAGNLKKICPYLDY